MAKHLQHDEVWGRVRYKGFVQNLVKDCTAGKGVSDKQYQGLVRVYQVLIAYPFEKMYKAQKKVEKKGGKLIDLFGTTREPYVPQLIET